MPSGKPASKPVSKPVQPVNQRVASQAQQDKFVWGSNDVTVTPPKTPAKSTPSAKPRK